MILIKEIQKGIFKNKILIESLKNNEQVYDSFFGERVFFMNRYERKWIRVPKSFPYQEKELITFSTLLRYVDPWKFNWQWVY